MPTRTPTRLSRGSARSEPLESRQLLSATLSVSSSLMVFNAVTTHASQVETLTLTNTGDAPLSLTGATVLADPAQSADASARFAVTNSLPATLAPGASFDLTLDYVPTTVGLDYALLDVASGDPANPVAAVKLRGIGTDGEGGVHQPSLMRILRAYGLPNYNQVGETDETSAYYPEPPAANTTEVNLQQMVKAGPGDVTFNVLASFVGNAATPLRLGWYQPANVSGTMQDLFHTVQSDYQSVYVQPVGNTSFDPGSLAFGLYNPSQTVRVNGQLVTDYTQDALNTNDPTDPRKFRFFPYIAPDGTAVPNAYIMTSTEWPAPIGYDFTNVVAIITNVKQAAPVANPDAVTATAATAASVNVLANDTATAGTLAPSTVTITTAPASGATASVDPSTGAVTYTPPAGFHGSDTFAYTVANSAGYTSAPATVTVSVSAGPGSIVTAPLSTTAAAGVPTSINVLAVDADAAAALLPGTVTVVSGPDHGGFATGHPDGTVFYTPAAGFSGTETFRYTVADAAKSVSNPTLVTVAVQDPAAAPVAANTVVAATAGRSTVLSVAATTASTAGLNLATLAVAAPPAHGTAGVDASGTITYGPDAGFVGTDSLSYTVADVNGHTSNVATVTFDVGVTIGNGAGNTTGTVRSLTVVGADGIPVTITLNRGTAHVALGGTGTMTVTKAGRATATGAGLTLGGIALSGTTRASTLSVAARRPINLSGLTDADPLGTVSAPTATFTGTVSLSGVTTLRAAAFDHATVTTGSADPTPVSLSVGAITDSTVAAAALRTVRVTGGITGSVLTTEGGIVSLTAAQLSGDTILAGASAGTTPATATLNTLGLSTIGTLRLTARAGTAFADTTVIAHAIGSATLGTVATAHGGVPDGLVLATAKSIAGTADGTRFRLSRVAASKVFGDFRITVPTV